MKCDDYLRNSTTGGRWARWRARTHAARCSRCAAVRASMLKMATELSRTEALTATQRRIWAGVAGTVHRRARFRPPVRLAIAGSLAALLAVAVWLGLHVTKTRLPQDQRAGAPSQDAIAMTFWTPQQLEQIEGQMKRLSDDLDRLAARTSLLDVQRDMRELVAAYPPLVIRN